MTRNVLAARAWSKPCRVCLVLAMLLVAAQAISLVNRAAHGNSDFSVIYRSAVLLNAGAGAELYTRADARNGWLHCIPLAGLLFFQPLALVRPGVAGALWSVFNLGLLAISVAALGKVVGALERRRRVYQGVFGWMVVILLLLSTGSLQVGQFSVLFVACWIFALYAAARESRFAMGLALAIPGAIKLYPALLLAVPLATNRRREVLWFGLGVLLVGVVAPFLVLGPRAWDLTLSFLQNVIFTSNGRVAESQRLGPHPNQGLDAVLLIYLSYAPAFHDLHRGMPHLWLEHQKVLQIADAARVLVLLLSGAAVMRWRRALRRNGQRASGWSASGLHATLQMAALWSATLYVVLPGAKSRYAVYTFLAFLPLLAAAAGARRLKTRRLAFAAWCALIAGCLMLIVVLVPDALRNYGVGFLGALALWIANLRLLSLEGRHWAQREPNFQAAVLPGASPEKSVPHQAAFSFNFPSRKSPMFQFHTHRKNLVALSGALMLSAAATTSSARADSLDQLGKGTLLSEARFASGTGNLLYLGAGTLLPLLEDGKDGKQHSIRTADALVTSTLITSALKVITREQRPDGSGPTGFPSGHSSAAFTVATMQAHYHPSQALYWYAGAAIISESRVQLNRHYLHDVVAGAAVGYFSARFELGRNRGLILRPFISGGDRQSGGTTGLSFSKSF